MVPAGSRQLPARLEPRGELAPTGADIVDRARRTARVTRTDGVRNQPLRTPGGRVLRSPSTPVWGPITADLPAGSDAYTPRSGAGRRVFHRCGRRCGCDQSQGGVRAGG